MKAAEDEEWWYRRTEYLLARPLTPRQGSWRRVYNSFYNCGTGWNIAHDYYSFLLIQVMLEIGSSAPMSNFGWVVSCNNLKGVALLLSIPNAVAPEENYNQCIREASYLGHTEMMKLLLADPRVDPSDYGNDALISAAEEGWTEIVQLLLADDRVKKDAGIQDNKALYGAVRSGFTDIVELLLECENVHKAEKERCADYGLSSAISNNHISTVRRLLKEESITIFCVSYACRSASMEILQLLLSDKRAIPSANGNHALAVARSRKRKDMEELLLSIPEVRALEAKMRD